MKQVNNKDKVLSKIAQEMRADVAVLKDADSTQFGIYTNATTPSMYYARYTRTIVDAASGNAFEKYRWLCFDATGTRTDCDPVFASIPDQNAFYGAMTERVSFEKLKDLPK